MKKVHIIGLIIVAATIGILVSVMGKTSEYASFKDVKANPQREFHVVGIWDSTQAIEYTPEKDPNYFAFALQDQDGEVEKVILRNNKPQDFEKSEKIVVVGRMEGDHFEASSILMKCPSKYNNEEVEVKSVSENLSR